MKVKYIIGCHLYFHNDGLPVFVPRLIALGLALKGDRRGQHSIRINDQWRICFIWNVPRSDQAEQEGDAGNAGGAYGVEIVDYH